MSRPLQGGACLALGIAVLLGLAAPVASEPAVPADVGLQVRAAYVHKFLNFAEWPPGPHGLAEGGSPLQLCVQGGVQLSRAMARLGGRSLESRSIAVRRIEAAGDTRGCHALVTGPAGAKVRRLLRGLGDRPVLSIGEGEDFLAAGGMIAFVQVDDTVRFEVDLPAVRRAGLELSSHLLRFAERVHTGEEPR